MNHSTLQVVCAFQKMVPSRRWGARLIFVVGAAIAVSQSGQVAAQVRDLEIHTIQKGQSSDLYFQINLKGRVFINIASRAGESNCANLWWIKWPLGNIEDLGRHCGLASFEIPTLFRNLAFSSKLRVGATENEIKIAVAASESVANSVKFDF